MKTLHKIAFILNPSSGSSKSKKQGEELLSYLNKTGKYEIFQTGSAEEMLEISKTLAHKNYEAVIACGGDGTLNLVSSQLLGSETAMAMIPLGSGNGFARHHKIPMKWENALKVILEPKISLRDTGIINQIHFLNICGIGYAAKITEEFKDNTKRGLAGYAKTVFKNLKTEAFGARLYNEHGMWEGKTWMVEFCNGSQWGNNFILEPGARDDDGTLNAVVFKQVTPVKIPAIGFRLATNQTDKSADILKFSGTGFLMEFEGSQPLHIDGDPVGLITGKAEVSVNPKSLKLWTI